jgi:hypothetical protein
MENKKETIAEAFGLNDDWASRNKADVHTSWDKHDLISDMFEGHLGALQNAELGETEGLSEYERKVYMAGYHMGVLLSERRFMASMIEKQGSAAIESFLREKLGGGKKED